MTIPRFAHRPDQVPRAPEFIEPAPQAPTAAFTYVVNGLSVAFSNQSTDPDGVIVSVHWDFGDTSTLPTAQFVASPNGLSVTFTDQSFDVSPGTIVSRLWNFGDGTTSTSQNPVKIYAVAGTYNVALQVTDDEGNQSTAQQQVLAVAGTGFGIGAYSYFTGPSSRETIGTEDILGGMGSCPPDQVISRINFCRTNDLFMVPNFAGGANTNYLTDGVFDPDKWKARWSLTDTPSIRAAIAQAVADGIVPGAILMDEPFGAKWGGYFSGSNGKARVDALATFSHAIHPTLPVGPTQDWSQASGQLYTVVDFIGTQYRFSKGSITAWRDGAIAMRDANGIKLWFSINVLDGGIPGRPCLVDTGDVNTDTGGTGTSGQACRVTALQLEDWGLLLGAATQSVLSVWRHDAAFFGDADNLAAFEVIADFLRTRPRVSLLRGA